MARKVVSLFDKGARIVSVFGKRSERVLVDMPRAVAIDLFDADIGDVAPSIAFDGVERDLEALRRRDPALADSGLAATALVLAREIDNPYNSATSKSMNATALARILELLRELAPEEEKSDRLDELSQRRDKRLAGA